MKTNHRRSNPPKFPTDEPLHNGYLPRGGPTREQKTDADGHTYTFMDSKDKPWGYLDKSLHGWGRESVFADKSYGASIGNDFANGHRGMAKAVRGAKKFVRSRFRASEKMELARIIRNDEHK